jgi:branched-chain amino acid transport system substrate-binding protein
MKFLLASSQSRRAMVAPAQAQETIRVGIALSQTGNLADSSTHYWHGVELWRDRVNASGGLLGKQVEFVIYDDRSDAATSARLYERLITSDKVDLLISTVGSAQAATATAVAEKHKRVMINGGGASESIHQRGFKHIFQTAARISAYVDGVDPMMKKYNGNPWRLRRARLRCRPRHGKGSRHGAAQRRQGRDGRILPVGR